MNKKTSRKRPQKQKSNKHSYESAGFIHMVREHSRSSIAEPHRNRARYDRRDERKMRQRGDWS